MRWLVNQDIHLFFQINREWTHPWLDSLFVTLRNPFTWAPLYLFLLVFCLLNFGDKRFFWILCFLLCFTFTDFISSSIIKPLTERIRPCHDPDIAHVVRMLVGCGGRWSFVSSHATNHFGLATFLFITFRNYIPAWRWIFFLWAAGISYAQVYVGLHFPLDIAGGALLGIFIGAAIGTLFERRIGLPAPSTNVHV